VVNIYQYKIFTSLHFLLRQDFSNFAKSSKAVKSLVEKENRLGSRGGSRPGTPLRTIKSVKIDKALAAFKVIQHHDN
jgi:hypothetical protein